MVEHDWKWESGTSRTCPACGTVRFSLDARGRSVRNQDAVQYRYQKRTQRGWSKAEPACEARL